VVTQVVTREANQVRLTEKSVEALRPPAEGNEITYDAALPGFGVRITAGGVVAFVLDYRLPGKKQKHRVTIGRFPETSLKVARQKAKQLQVQIRGGFDPLAPPPEAPSGRSVADMMAKYLAEHAEKKNRRNTVRNARVHIAFINSRIGNYPVDGVTEDQIKSLREELRSTPTQANRIRSTLSKAFAEAVKWKWRGDNPVKVFERYPETQRESWLTPEEIGRVFEQLDKHQDQNAASALRLIILTGSRKSEVLSAKWEDFKDGRWRKPSHHNKRKETIHVPLSADAIAVLEKMRKQSDATGWLFPGRNGDHLKDIRKIWAKIRNQAKIPPRPLWGDVRPHDLRHSFASVLVSAGESLQIVGKLMGHTQAATTERYAHLSDEALRDAANSFGDLIRRRAK
jgi:integrase